MLYLIIYACSVILGFACMFHSRKTDFHSNEIIPTKKYYLSCFHPLVSILLIIEWYNKRNIDVNMKNKT